MTSLYTILLNLQYVGIILLILLIFLGIAGVQVLLDGRRSPREQRLHDEEQRYGGL
jgi:hypothetical protein